VTVVAEDSGLVTWERLWPRVRQALEPLGQTITIEIEFRPAGNARRSGGAALMALGAAPKAPWLSSPADNATWQQADS